MSELSTKAEKTGNYGAAVNAEVNKGKAAGLYVTRTEDVGSGRATLDQFLTAVEELLGMDQAKKAAIKLGMQWPSDVTGNA